MLLLLQQKAYKYLKYDTAAVYTPAIRNQHRLSAEYRSTAQQDSSRTGPEFEST
jgi:hypothetical protein